MLSSDRDARSNASIVQQVRFSGSRYNRERMPVCRCGTKKKLSAMQSESLVHSEVA
jgi:hypothetical protein